MLTSIALILAGLILVLLSAGPLVGERSCVTKVTQI